MEDFCYHGDTGVGVEDALLGKVTELKVSSPNVRVFLLSWKPLYFHMTKSLDGLTVMLFNTS